MSPHGGRLGPGWQHAYEVRLIPQPDGGLVFLNDSFVAQAFAHNVDGSYTPTAGFHETLVALGAGWKLTFVDGIEYRFRSDG